MDFWQSLALLGRRWRFFGPALLLAIVLTGGVYQAVKPQYQATTDLLLTTPNTIGLPSKTLSPYDNYGSLNTVASIVSYAETSQLATRRLKSEGVPDPYTVGTDPTGAVPELILTVTASTPAAAQSEDAILTNDADNTLLRAQQGPGVNPKTDVRTQILGGRPVSATKDDKSRIRVAVAAGVVLVFLAIALTFMYDSIMRRRSSRGDDGQSDEYEGEVSRLRPADGFEQRQDAAAGANSRVSKRGAAQALAPAPGLGPAPAHVAQDR